MAKLTTAQRKAMPADQFALPGGRFPVEDKPHARNALARASQGVNAGTLSPGEAATVRRKANAVLGKANGGQVGNLTAREAFAATQPTAAKAQAAYNGPSKFDAIGRRAPRIQHPVHAGQFKTPASMPARVDVGAEAIARAKGRK